MIMTKADSVLSTQGEPAPEFDNLAAAVSPMWHPAVPKLAGATERVASRLEFWGASNNTSGSFVRAARDLAKELIDFLDLIGGDPDFENELLDDDSEELEIDHPGGEDGTAEPSPGSIELHPSLFGYGRDRDGDQTGWASGNRTDLEEDNDSGIGDQDGLDEQVPVSRLAKRGDGLMEAWHKRHALQLASQLPDKVEDANLVIQALQDLVSTWLHPATEEAPRVLMLFRERQLGEQVRRD
jgi:hypothetical protein